MEDFFSGKVNQLTTPKVYAMKSLIFYLLAFLEKKTKEMEKILISYASDL